MPWSGGFKGPDANLMGGAVFMGAEPGGWLRYHVDTGLNVDMSMNTPGIYGARLYITGAGAQGSGVPGPGGYLMDFEYTAEINPATPFFVSGAAANHGTDPIGRPPGTSRLYLILRLRPTRVPDGISSVCVTQFYWQVFRVS